MSTVSEALTWKPGDPLYRHPSERASGDGNYVRQLIQLIADEESAVRLLVYGTPSVAVCRECLVSWPPTSSPNCWVCGAEAPNYAYALEVEQNRRESFRGYAILDGGPGHGRRFMLPDRDADEAWLVYDEDGASRWPFLQWSLTCTPVSEHRYVRTDEWRNNHGGYVFRYEGVA